MVWACWAGGGEWLGEGVHGSGCGWVVDGGAPRETWGSCVRRDVKAMGIEEEVARDRCAWRNITGGPTRASADA